MKPINRHQPPSYHLNAGTQTDEVNASILEWRSPFAIVSPSTSLCNGRSCQPCNDAMTSWRLLGRASQWHSTVSITSVISLSPLTATQAWILSSLRRAMDGKPCFDRTSFNCLPKSLAPSRSCLAVRHDCIAQQDTSRISTSSTSKVTSGEFFDRVRPCTAALNACSGSANLMIVRRLEF